MHETPISSTGGILSERGRGVNYNSVIIRGGSAQFFGRMLIPWMGAVLPVDEVEVALLGGFQSHDRFGVVAVPALATALDATGNEFALALGGAGTDLPLLLEEAGIV